MTGPIQPNTGSVPLPSQGTQQTSEKLQEAASKVSQATGSSSQEVTKASVPKGTATTTSVPDPQKAAAVVKQSLIKEINLETLLKMAKPVRNIILTGLTDIELNAFEIALSRGKDLQESEKLAFEALKKQIDEIKQDRLLKEILADHPTWKIQVEAWKDASLANKIWLLQLYELRNLGVNIPQIDAAPSTATLSLLEPSTKKAISEALAKVTALNCYNKGLKKCPKAIGLLVNLQELDLLHNQLTAPPDVSRNVNLQRLYLNKNQLTSPPDISRNVNLQELLLNDNQLTAPPDVSHNVNLQSLDLGHNQLTAPPDVSRNGNLQGLCLDNNKLTADAKAILAKLKSERTSLYIEF